MCQSYVDWHKDGPPPCRGGCSAMTRLHRPTPLHRRADASLLVARFVLERDRQPHPKTGHPPVLDHDVLPHHLSHAQVTNGVGRGLDGTSSRRFLRLVADTDHLGHPVHTLRHSCLLCSAVSALPGVRKQQGLPYRKPLAARPKLPRLGAWHWHIRWILLVPRCTPMTPDTRCRRRATVGKKYQPAKRDVGGLSE